MPPPPSYIDITSLPFSRVVTQAEFNAGTYGGVANEVWFRYVAAIPTAFGGFTNSGGTFTPRTRLYESDGTTLLKTISPSRAWYWILEANTYYIRITRSAGGATDSDFTSNFASTILNPAGLPVDSIIINDDSDGFPATAWTIDGTFLGFLTAVPASETGSALPNGISLWHDRFSKYGGKLALFDTSYNLLIGGLDTSPSLGSASAALIPPVTNDRTKFYVLNKADDKIYTITEAGVISSAIATLATAVGSISGLGISNDGTIAYWTEGYDSNAIHAHDLNTDTPLPDLYTAPITIGVDAICLTAVNEHPGDILVLEDDSIVTWYRDWTNNKDVLVHLSAAGAVLHSTDFTVNRIDHLAYSPDDPDRVRLWLYIDDDFAQNATFGEFDLATGAFVVGESFDVNLASTSTNPNTGSDEKFIPSTSCTFVSLLAGSGAPAGGLLQITTVTPTKRNDTVHGSAGGTIDTAIVAFFKTYLMGG